MATDEVQVILDFAAAVRHQEGRLIHHLDNRASIQRYRRKADEVAAIVGKRRILDWGCGFGQMTFLLERRGLSVVPFDIESSRRPPYPVRLGRTRAGVCIGPDTAALLDRRI